MCAQSYTAVVVVAAAVTAGFVAPAHGQLEGRRTVYLGVTSGWNFFSDDSRLGGARSAEQTPDPAPLAGLRIAIDTGDASEGRAAHKLTAELEGHGTFSLVNGLTESEEDIWAPVYSWRGHLIFSVLNRNMVQPFVLAGAGGQTLVTDASFLTSGKSIAALHWGLGVRIVTGRYSVRVDHRQLFSSDRRDGVSVTHELMLGFGIHFDNSCPKCPVCTHSTKEKVAAGDLDGDGLVDLDKCPNDPEDEDGFEDDDGCPDLDNDGDEILDKDDQCPDKPENKNGVDDDDGCPEEDLDGDGLVGAADQCPNEPEDKDGFEDNDGCPENDNDGDGILDSDDSCPDEAEVINQYQDTDGCPDEVPDEIERFTGRIEGIVFQTGKATIQSRSFIVLSAAVAVLKKYPQVRLEIHGHTDAVGNDQRNLILSAARAAAVRDFLISKGIEADRLEAKGFGETKPIASNDTRAGRAQNRRVEFVRK